MNWLVYVLCIMWLTVLEQHLELCCVAVEHDDALACCEGNIECCDSIWRYWEHGGRLFASEMHHMQQHHKSLYYFTDYETLFEHVTVS